MKPEPFPKCPACGRIYETVAEQLLHDEVFCAVIQRVLAKDKEEKWKLQS